MTPNSVNNQTLTLCPMCQGKVAVTAKTCPHCGHPFFEQPNNHVDKTPREIAVTTGFIPGMIPVGSNLTEESLEAIFGEGRETVRNRFLFGELNDDEVVSGVPGVPVGNHWLMRQKAIDEWIARNERPAQRGRRGKKRRRPR